MALYRYAVRLDWSGSGSPGYNVWHFRTTPAVEIGTERNALIASLKTWYQGMAQFMPASVTVTGPSEAIRDFNGAPEYVGVTGFSVTGGASVPDYLPLSSAIVIGWRTPSATRSGRGRTFLSPLSRGTLEANGTPTAGTLSSIQTISNTFISSFSGLDNGAFGVWSESQGVLRDFTSARVRDTYAVLTSRRD